MGKLLALAGKRFEKLEPIEALLLLVLESYLEDNSLKPFCLESTNRIRSRFLTWLLTDQEAQKYIRTPSIVVRYAVIEGDLDLSYATLYRPLRFENCVFDGRIFLRGAHTERVEFQGCELGCFYIDSAEVDGDLVFVGTLGQLISGQSAKIKGNLWFKGINIWSIGPQGVGGGAGRCGQPPDFISDVGLNAPGLRIGGDLVLQATRCQGPINLVSTHIGGALRLLDVEVAGVDGKGHALWADYIRVAGPALLDSVTCGGAISLGGADFGGQVTFMGVRVAARGGVALKASGVKARDVFFRDKEASGEVAPVMIQGEVRLDGARIEGSLELSGSFSEPNGVAIDLSGANVGSQVIFANTFRSKGEVRMVATEVGIATAFAGTFEKSQGDHPGSPALAVEASHLKVGHNLVISESFSASGIVRFYGANIGSQLVLRKATWACGGEPKAHLDLRNARIGRISDTPESWPLFDLDGTVYEDLEEKGWDTKGRLAWLRNQPHFRPRTYSQLAYVYWKRGDEAAATQVLMARQDERLLEKGLGCCARVGFWIAKSTIGYGYRTWRVLPWLLVLTLLGYFFYHGAYSQGHIVPSAENRGFVVFSPFLYSLDLTLPIDLQQEKYWVIRRGTPWWLTSWLSVQIIAGWVLTALFIASVSGLARRLGEATMGEKG